MATDYNKISSLNTDDEIKKAIRALNMRVRRTASSKLAKSSSSLSKVKRFKNDLINQSSKFVTQNKLPASLITKSEMFSTNLSKLSTSSKKLYAKVILNYLHESDLTLPGIKNIIKKRAANLSITLPQYMERLEFWELYNDIQVDEKYDSGEVIKVVDIIKDANMSYEEKVKAATDIMEKMGVDPTFKPKIKVGENNVMSAAEFRKKFNERREIDLINKYATKKV